MKKKEKEIFLGDIVKTNKSFKPEDENGNLVPVTEPLEGTVVTRRANGVGVDFGTVFPFTHSLDGVLPEPTGIFVLADWVDLVETFSHKDKDLAMFVNLSKERAFRELYEIPREISKLVKQADDKKGKVNSLFRDIKNLESEIRKSSFEIDKLSERRGSVDVSVDSMARQYSKLIAHKDIAEIEFRKDDSGIQNMIVTTKDLTYKDSRGETTPPFNLGAYKIKIPINLEHPGDKRSLSIINYKKHVQKKKFHPCVNGFDGACLGDSVGNEVNKYIQVGQYPQLIYLLLGFLKEPNYGGPHISAELFSAALPVTIRPRNPLNWFSKDYWNEKETWDGEEFTRRCSSAEHRSWIKGQGSYPY